ncbi:MAG: NAD-dependent deacylase [Planctomycetes bacterium]|nr:NAD-dependent deacylase [Planctomycetota bacterium]
MRVCVLTGAGISAESGVPTFRDAGGLWEGHRVEDVATPEGFARDPVCVYRFYDERRKSLGTVEPNPAHHALAKLEAALGEDFLLVTQNIDDLHDRCGHVRLRHMHGELLAARNEYGDVLSWRGDLGESDRCPTTGTRLRPHVVWFGEMPLHMLEIEEFLSSCDVFCAIGTSGLVYPAAGFASIAFHSGAHCVEINLQATGGPFHEVRSGAAGTMVPAWVDELLTEIDAEHG